MEFESPAQAFVNLWRSTTTTNTNTNINNTNTNPNHTNNTTIKPSIIQKLNEILTQTPLSGRIIHGKPNQPGFGKLLSADEWKRLSWVFGTDAIRGLLGKQPRDILLHLGFTEKWIHEKVTRGVKFLLVVFPTSSIPDLREATWDGVRYLLDRFYSEVRDKISIHYDRIRSMTIEELCGVAGYDMETVNLVGRYDHQTGESHDGRYVSLQRLQKRSGTLVEVRQFLYDEIGLGRLFTGLGYTVKDNGGERVGWTEYLARNMKLDEIHGLAVVTPDEFVVE